MATGKYKVFWFLPGHAHELAASTSRTGLFDVHVMHASTRGFQYEEGELPHVVVLDGCLADDLEPAFKKRLRDSGAVVLIHSPAFDANARKKAVDWKADDYLFGDVQSDLFLQMQRLIELKRHQDIDNEPDKTVQPENLPVYKFWPYKRAFDFTLALLAILTLSPVFILVALIIKLESRGPIIYKSKRAGSGYKIFNFYKFRSMRQDADAMLKELVNQNQYAGSNDAVFYKFKDDPRVTPFGRFIRKTSIDELPQLFNVLLGDMSLVGNRPLPLYEAEKLTRDKMAWRFIAPAGLTGLWQITKRGKDNMTPDERIQLDVEYAKKNSLLLDMKILLMTLPAIIQKERV
jgi:lipopolysaccharide/colanic/teichoic acid biosynthesis glycosyltransferase